MKQKFGFFSFFVEHTGGPWAEIVAVGFAHASPETPTVIHSHLVCKDTEWKRAPKMQDKGSDKFTVPDNAGLAREIDGLLKEAEDMYEETMLVMDDSFAMFGMLHAILVRHKYNHLGYTRQGQTRKALCVDSWQHGMLKQFPPMSRWREFDAMHECVKLRPSPTQDPANNAIYIIDHAFRSIAFCQRRIERARTEMAKALNPFAIYVQ